MMISLHITNEWVKLPPTPDLVFVIRPGAGTFQNKDAYKMLESKYNVVYFAKSGGEYDIYPPRWYDNKQVSTEGKHLGGIVGLIEEYITKNNAIPAAIITGSRGGQVTLGKIWETLWRGPSIVINAGCLTTHTEIPKEVTPLFISMEKDYFERVNSISKIAELCRKLTNYPNQEFICIHLKNHTHMPKLKGELLPLLLYSTDLALDKIDTIPINADNMIVQNLLHS